MSATTSRLRQQLRRISEQHDALVRSLLDEQGPLVRGVFGSRRRKCGYKNCRCTRGQLHESKQLLASDLGRARRVHVPARDEVEVAAGAARYRRFRQRRKQLADLARRHLEIVDELGHALLKPYPPGNPISPRAPGGPRPGAAKAAKVADASER